MSREGLRVEECEYGEGVREEKVRVEKECE